MNENLLMYFIAATTGAFAGYRDARCAGVPNPVSKDNVIFGVRAVDGTGHRSVAVTPLPDR